jgi:hypothetical protein
MKLKLFADICTRCEINLYALIERYKKYPFMEQ